MSRRRVTEATLNSLEYAWPEILAPRDPWSGDEARPDATSYANYRAFGGEALTEAAYAEADREFLRVYRAILDGQLPWGAIGEPAKLLNVWGAIRHDRRPLDPAPEHISDPVLADHAEDWVPDVGQSAPDRVLGPWVEYTLPLRARQSAAAAMVFSPGAAQGLSAPERVVRTDPKPPPAYRDSLRAVGAAPPCLWKVGAEGELEPALPLAQLFLPKGRVAGVPAGPAVLGRAVPGPEGWWLAAGLALPGLPPVAGIVRRLSLEMLRLRREERRSSWEDLLRKRGEVLYRLALGWAWFVLRDGDEEWDWPVG